LAKEPHLANTHAHSDNYWTPLFWAVSQGYADIVKVLINAGADIEDQTQQVTPLYWAVRKGHTRIAKYLMNRGANVNARMGRGVTALHSVASRACVKLLTDNGADVHARDAAGRTPLHSLLSIEGHWIVLNVLRGKRPHVDITVSQQLAVREQVAIAKILLAHDADIHAKDSNGYTPLQLAEIAGYKTLVDEVNALVTNGEQER
jgi:ankyrin repeat protein